MCNQVSLNEIIHSYCKVQLFYNIFNQERLNLYWNIIFLASLMLVFEFRMVTMIVRDVSEKEVLQKMFGHSCIKSCRKLKPPFCTVISEGVRMIAHLNVHSSFKYTQKSGKRKNGLSIIVF